MRSAETSRKKRWVVAAVVLTGVILYLAGRDTAPPPREGSEDSPGTAHRSPGVASSGTPDTPSPARGPLTLSGRVLQADGRPFVGRMVVTENPLPKSIPMTSGRAMWFEDLAEPERHTVSVATDREGRFSCSGLRAGTYAITCEVKGGTRLLAADLPLPSAQEVLLDLSSPAGTIEGRVVSLPDPRPIPGAHVTLIANRRRNDPPLQSTDTNDEGWFEVARPQIDYEINVTATGFASRTTPGFPGDQPGVIRLDRCGTITGRVVDGDGMAVSAVTVLSGELSAFTDAEGEFLLSDVPAGRQWLHARGPGVTLGRPRAVVVEPGGTSEITLTVSPGVVIEGLVVNEQSGPVARVVVVAGARSDRVQRGRLVHVFRTRPRAKLLAGRRSHRAEAGPGGAGARRGGGDLHRPADPRCRL